MIGLILGIIVLICGFVSGAALTRNHYEPWNKLAPVMGIILCAIMIILSCVSYVPTGYTGIVTTFGKVHNETLDAGINFHTPWDNVIKMDNREQRTEFELEAFSRDIQQVGVQGSVNYNIDKVTAMNLYRDVGTEYAKILIGPRIQEDVKIVIAKYTAENLVENRQKMSDEIYDLLKTELAPKGINVISLAIENIDFTDSFESAVEAKQVATQKKLTAETEQAQKTMEEEAAAKRAIIAENAKAEQAVIAAKADLEVVQIQAEASLYAGQREAEMNQRISEALTDKLIFYYLIKQWNGELPQFFGGGTTLPILNMNGVE